MTIDKFCCVPLPFAPCGLDSNASCGIMLCAGLPGDLGNEDDSLTRFVEITMNIQIYGTLKCQDTKKAQRYFKERRISFQFVDLTRKGLSKGELNNIKAAVGIDNLVDREGKTYAEKNLKYLIHDVEEEILKEPLLLRTPIVRNGREATAGYQPDLWKAWK
jgi:arsenate reductase (glutaredoxin)